MKNSDLIVNAILGQIYSRLTLAATQGLHVYYNDLCPVVFGIQFTRLNKEQADVIWDILIETMRMDAKAGRLPLAALYISRKYEKKPGAGFYNAYRTLYGKDIDENSWPDLVRQIWESYSLQDKP